MDANAAIQGEVGDLTAANALLTGQVSTLEGQVGMLESDSLVLMNEVDSLTGMNGSLMTAVMDL